MKHHKLTATQVLRKFRDRSLKVTDYVESLLESCVINEHLNAIISQDREAILTKAVEADKSYDDGNQTGILCGLPIVLKDNINTADLPTTGGTEALANHRPKKDAPVAHQLWEAGAALFGKTGMHELAFGITSNNACFGAVRNPYDPDKIAGGSSGGSAVAVAKGMAPFGLGTDTGGSCRIPAALCGVVGFRPTIGRYSQEGLIPISHTRDTIGHLACTVEDVLLLHSVISGDSVKPDLVSLKGLKLGLPKSYFRENLDSQLEAVINQIVNHLSSEGVEWIEVDVPNVEELNAGCSFPVALYEVVRDLRDYLMKYETGLSLEELIDQVRSPDVKGVLSSQMNGDEVMPEAAYLAAIQTHRPSLQSTLSDYFSQQGVDAIVYPTTPLPARPIGGDETVALNGIEEPTFPTYIRNCDPGSNAGIPCLSIPVGMTSDGLPVGMELAAPMNQDHRLLSIGMTLESVIEPIPSPIG
ncbi:MAG: indoleacetamide hydrolase [Deltaproteobacteria bacterium]|nr:indoleacetamide hydrolase [Deltaproteobacteria bacterium]